MKHKVIDIIKTFSEDDIKSFSKFLNSPFFNESVKLRKLFKILLKFYPEFTSKLLTDATISKKLNPNRPFNKSTIKVLFSDLYTSTLKYLSAKNFMSKKFESQDFLREELFNKKLYRTIEENIFRTESEFKEHIEINALYYLNKFKLATDKSNLMYLNKIKTNKKIINSDVEILTERGTYLTYFFVIEILKEFDNLKTINKTYNLLKYPNLVYKLFKKFDFISLLNLLIQNADNQIYGTILKIYLLLYLTFLNLDDEKNYFEYKKLVLNNLHILNIDEKKFHVSRLIKYCMLKRDTETSSRKFNNELFFLYDYLLQKGYYKSSIFEFMPAELFRNILKLALKLKKYNWVINFIKKYKKRLEPARRGNMYNFSMAELFFSKKMFKNALVYFHKITIDDFIFKIDLKNLLLVAYFESKQYEAALSLVGTYMHFLSTDKTLSPFQKKRYKNFVSAVHKLLICKTSAEMTSSLDVSFALRNDFPYKDWVNEKLSEIPARVRKVV